MNGNVGIVEVLRLVCNPLNVVRGVATVRPRGRGSPGIRVANESFLLHRILQSYGQLVVLILSTVGHLELHACTQE